jgi:transposase
MRKGVEAPLPRIGDRYTPGKAPYFSHFTIKERSMTRYVGIDLAKRSMEVCILAEGKPVERHGLKTDERGQRTLIRLLRAGDEAGLEVNQYGTRLCRTLMAEVAGCRAHALNPGELRVIWKSRKKTDKEDALKLAKYLRDTPEGEWVEVPLPSEEEEAYRSDISMKEFLKKERNMAVNRLHGLYGQAGIIDVTKKDLKDGPGRKARRGELPEGLRGYAEILEEQLALFEKRLEGMEERVAKRTREHGLAPYVMSIPGVGIGIAAVLLAYLGDGSRFTKAGQVANYAGFTPRVDCSGEQERYGPIARHQFCHPIRAITLEGVWALIRSKNGGALLAKYESLSGRMSKKKSAVAVARKMVALAWLLIKRREYYRGADEGWLKKKLAFYKVKREEQGAIA